MIDFELPEQIAAARKQTHNVAVEHMRPVAREFDEREHEKPWDYINVVWKDVKKEVAGQLAALEQTDEERTEAKKKNAAAAGGQPMVMTAVITEERSWGDAGLNLCNPGPRLGGAAINAVGTPEQKRRFFERFTDGDPK